MSLGYDHSSFWDQTPRTISLTFYAAKLRQVREHNERMSLAWHMAALSRAKKLPKLKTLIASTSSRKRKTWQEQMAVMDLWTVRQMRIEQEKKLLKGSKR